MATTLTSTKPMVAVFGPGGTVSIPQFTGICAAATAKGDVLIYSTQKLALDNADIGTSVVVGVASHATSAADLALKYAPAFPGMVFEANIIDNASDQTAAITEDVGAQYDIIESADGFACVDQNNTTTPPLQTIGYGKQTGPTQQQNGIANGVGLAVPTETYAAGSVLNPRVLFVWIDSMWSPAVNA